KRLWLGCRNIVAYFRPSLADKDKFGKLLENAPRSHKARYLLINEKTNEPAVGTPYSLKLASGAQIAGYTDNEGKTFLVHTAEPTQVSLLTPERKVEPRKVLIKAGESGPTEMTMDYRNPTEGE
ncbi:hypothetical protein ACW9H6_26810, partial [Pseudomonas sp. SDO528_S397]